jgi:hypothetical protein
MAAEVRVDIHHFAPRCLLGLFDVAATELADWSEFDAEAERWGIEARGLSREDLDHYDRELHPRDPCHRASQAHQEASDFVRWGRRGGQRILALYGRPYFSLLARFRWDRIELEAFTEHRAGSLEEAGRCDPPSSV